MKLETVEEFKQRFIKAYKIVTANFANNIVHRNPIKALLFDVLVNDKKLPEDEAVVTIEAIFTAMLDHFDLVLKEIEKLFDMDEEDFNKLEVSETSKKELKNEK